MFYAYNQGQVLNPDCKYTLHDIVHIASQCVIYHDTSPILACNAAYKHGCLYYCHIRYAFVTQFGICSKLKTHFFKRHFCQSPQKGMRMWVNGGGGWFANTSSNALKGQWDLLSLLILITVRSVLLYVSPSHSVIGLSQKKSSTETDCIWADIIVVSVSLQ